MKILKKIGNFFDRIEHDIRLFSIKPSLIVGLITFGLGVVSWIVGGSIDRVSLIYIFPRSAVSIGFMYFLWGISYVFIGIIIGGILFGCEKYKRREALKILVFIILSFILTLCVHPLFFKCMAPFFTFLFILVACVFCFLAISAAVRIYSMWSLCLMLHFLWLIYNCYLAFAIALIN